MKIKSIMILTVMLSVASFSLNAKKIKVTRKGSDDGVHFNRVAESHGLFQSSLSCMEPGAITCGWTEVPSVGGHGADEIEKWVLGEIKNGKNSGSTRYNEAVFVEWNYDSDTDELNITMTDEF